MFEDIINELSNNGDIYITVLAVFLTLTLIIYTWARSWASTLVRRGLRMSHRQRHLQEWLEDKLILAIEGGRLKMIPIYDKKGHLVKNVPELTTHDAKYLYKLVIRSLELTGISMTNVNQIKADIRKRIASGFYTKKVPDHKATNGHRRPIKSMLKRRGHTM
jgi:hypothetical protein